MEKHIFYTSKVKHFPKSGKTRSQNTTMSKTIPLQQKNSCQHDNFTEMTRTIRSLTEAATLPCLGNTSLRQPSRTVRVFRVVAPTTCKNRLRPYQRPGAILNTSTGDLEGLSKVSIDIVNGTTPPRREIMPHDSPMTFFVSSSLPRSPRFLIWLADGVSSPDVAPRRL